MNARNVKNGVVGYPEEAFFISDFHDQRINNIQGLPKDMPKRVYLANSNIHEALFIFSLGSLVKSAYDKLTDWCAQPHDTFGNMMLRQIAEAEMICRDYLFSLRTCLDHMEKYVKDLKDQGTDLLKLFTDGTHAAYDGCKEYGFTYHLRNCVQHCENIVFKVDSNTESDIKTSKAILLSNYDGWNEYDKEFLCGCEDYFSLTKLFSKAQKAFEKAIAPVVQYTIDKGTVTEDLLFLRNWGDSLSGFFQHDVQCFHLIVAIRPDQTPVDMNGEVPMDAELTGYLIDWEMIYQLTNCIICTNGKS